MRAALILTLICLGSSSAAAQVQMPSIFTNDMVLQRGMPIPVWGTASQGESVTVKLAGQTVSTKAVGGSWSLRLKALPAGGPYTMTVQGKSTLTFTNVMVGEVWICAGQSNMSWKLRDAATGGSAIPTSGQWGIRIYTAGLASPWRVSGPATIQNFSAIAFFFAREMAKTLKVPIGLIQAAKGSTAVSTWKPGGTEFQAKIAPLVPFAVRGTIWYQGEEDAQPGLSYTYGSGFRSMIRAWRRSWGQTRFPFLYVQLPRYTKQAPYWMHVREGQLEALAVPDTVMTCLMDLQSFGIHPSNKLPVGVRLAHSALNRVYGYSSFVPSGPIYDPSQTVVSGNTISVGFKEATGGLAKSSTLLRGFEVAGSNLVYVYANAQIVGNKVVVSASGISNPVAVRYGWAGYPWITLVNGAGLPASPFRTYSTYEKIGTGCGPSPAPKLEVTLLPRRGRPFELRLFDCPKSMPGIMFIGASDKQWGIYTLPLTLGPIGMGSCKLYASGDFLGNYVTDSAGSFDVRIQFPNILSLHGAKFANQAFILSPGSNTIGIVATNGGKGRIGER